MKKEEIGEMIENMNSAFSNVRYNAVHSLKNGAEEGVDIGTAISALSDVFTKEQSGSHLKYSAAYALVYHYFNHKDWSALKSLLKHEDPAVRKGVAALREAVKKSGDISHTIPFLVELLNDKDEAVKKNGCEALVYHYLNHATWTEITQLLKQTDATVKETTLLVLIEVAKKGSELAPVMEALIETLKEENRTVKYLGASAITYQYVNTKQWKEIETLLKHEDSGMRKNVSFAITESASNGANVSLLFPSLVIALKDTDKKVRENATEALKYSVRNGIDISSAILPLTQTLKDEDGYVRSDAAEALKEAAEHGTDMSKAVPYLVDALRDKNGSVRGGSARALRAAIKGGINISSSIESLINALKDQDRDVGGSAAWILEAAAQKGVDIASAIPVLANAIDDWNISPYATGALKEAAGKGVDISIATPHLLKVLDSTFVNVKSNAAQSLVYQYVNSKQWNEIEHLLKHTDQGISKSAAVAIDDALKKGISVPQNITELVTAANPGGAAV